MVFNHAGLLIPKWYLLEKNVRQKPNALAYRYPLYQGFFCCCLMSFGVVFAFENVSIYTVTKMGIEFGELLRKFRPLNSLT